MLGDIGAAEDAVSEAFAAALQRWPESGAPPSPAGWIITTARNRAIDQLRREAVRADKHAPAALLNAESESVEEGAVRDDRLRLVFTCCHPALARPAQVALCFAPFQPTRRGRAGRQGRIAYMADRLATQLILIARDPGTGRLRSPRVLDMGLRAALFTDLVLAGRVTEQYRAPFVQRATDSGDRILDAVERAVEQRPGVRWWRWFRHVRADRTALVGELLADGRWTQVRDGLWPSYRDEDPDPAVALAYATQQVVEKRTVPADPRQAVLAALAVMCGSTGRRPRPRALRRELKPIMQVLATSEMTGAAIVPQVLAGAAKLIRRPGRR